jgi:hypothetical protein
MCSATTGVNAVMSASATMTRTEWHYSIEALRWGSTFFAGVGDASMVGACVDALSRKTAAGGFEAASALTHALGEQDLLRGDAPTAAERFHRSLDLLGEIHAPYERAQASLRSGMALMKSGRREEAIEALLEPGDSRASSAVGLFMRGQHVSSTTSVRESTDALAATNGSHAGSPAADLT